VKKPDDGFCRLLRLRRKRPCRSHGTEQRDELATCKIGHDGLQHRRTGVILQQTAAGVPEASLNCSESKDAGYDRLGITT
jgi:hypothetical protein